MSLKFFLQTTLLLASYLERLLNWNKTDWNGEQISDLHQFKSIGKDHFWYLVMHTKWNIEAMAVTLFLDHILLLEVYSLKRVSNWHKNDGMVNNCCKYSSNFEKSTDTAKDC